jgi:hypothetical protein
MLTLAPLAIPALLALKRPAREWQDMAVRVWPIAGIIVYFLPLGTFPYHAFQGLSVPLAILAVQGVLLVRPHPRPWLVGAAVFIMTVPGIAHRIDVAKGSVHAGGDPFFVFPGEVQALKALEADPRPGGVLAPTYAGYMVPYRTGRETYIGAISWSPDWHTRQRRSDALFEGRLTGSPARRFVASTHARFLFEDCRAGLVDLTQTLGPLLQSTQRYGCATVWVLRPRPGMAAVGGPDH